MARASNSRTVIIDGHAVMKDTIVRLGPLQPLPFPVLIYARFLLQACGSWEAVKTITSDPEMVKKLANAKKSRKKFDHEDFCMVCKDGGEFPSSYLRLAPLSLTPLLPPGDVFHCTSCPRSCHGPCSGFTPSELNAMMFVIATTQLPLLVD